MKTLLPLFFIFVLVASLSAMAQSIDDKNAKPGDLGSPKELPDKTLLKKTIKPGPTPDRDRSKPINNSNGKSQSAVPTDVD